MAAAGRSSPSTSPQLREKQKAKRYYGVLEKQFRNYYEKASRRTGITGENLLRFLELRLDNVVYRLGFAASRAQARQFVRHGHFLVNGRRVNIPSFQLRPDDVLSMRTGSAAEEPIRDATDLTASVASWLQADHDNLTGKVLRHPGPRRDRHAGSGAANRRALLEVMNTMLEFQIPQITAEEVDDHRGVFTVEPLDRGFGYTFGNSLRRVLLSSLEGCAVTSVKIEGVQHEFTTIPGVREDVTDIILNLKGLVCRLHGEAPEIEADIAKDGPGVVTAADIVSSADLEILNPDLVHLPPRRRRAARDDAHDRPRPRLRPGRRNKGFETTIGVIPVDSIFSPVRRVTYHVDTAASASAPTTTSSRSTSRRTAPSTRSDAVTAGRRAPDPAARHLHDLDTAELLSGVTAACAGTEPEAPQAHGMENILIEELELGVRSYNCLKRVGIETIGDLVSKTEQELAAIPNFGKKSIEEVKATLAQHGLYLRGDEA